MRFVVDTSVWINHFRSSDADLAAALEAGEVMAQPFVVGELACATIFDRRTVLSLLHQLPPAPIAGAHEVLVFIESRGLMGRGRGYVDVHLLASAAIADEVRLWTADRRLAEAAHDEGLAR